MIMKKIFKELEELPITLNATEIAQTLGISKAMAYNLLRSQGFPTLKIGSRLIVSKTAFIMWIEQNSGNVGCYDARRV
jgi:predicted DNA-binding transcriptional regulator AlpA